MKAVNLVPKDYRRGRLAGRGGEVFSYFLIGGLAALLLAVTAIVLTNNKISDNKAEVAKLSQERDDAQAEADALAPYANFASLAQARTATVSSLAQSRFDWERIMRELAQILPSDIWLTQLSGTVLPDVPLDGAAGLTTRSSVPGPALEIIGCGPSQDSVAKFVAALEDIDGVTRVGVQSSEKPESATSGGTGGSTDCRTKDFIAKFELIVAFDAAPVPAAAGVTTTPPAAPATPATPTTPDASGVDQAQQQQVAGQQSVQDAKGKAEKATNYIPGN
jgi:Tfp pilus assembly protein PilN